MVEPAAAAISREPAVIAAEIPGQTPAPSPDSATNEVVLLRSVDFVVGARRPVLLPGAPGGARSEARDEECELRDVGLDELVVEACGRQLGTNIVAAVGLRALQPGMQEDVTQHPAPQGVAPSEERPEVAGSDPVRAPTKPCLEGDAAVRLQHQRVEELHAELPVSEPRLSSARTFEGSDVDEDRPHALPLHVVGGRVLDRQPFVERRTHEPKLQQRGVLKHREGPLVRIRDERDPLATQRPLPPRCRLDLGEGSELAFVRHPRFDEISVGDEPAEKIRRGERPPALEPVRAQGTQHPLVRVEDPAVPVAKRAAIRTRARPLLDRLAQSSTRA